MREKILLWMQVVAIASISILLSNCVDTEKDLYDPEYQTNNPMGDDFAAPEGFDWAMTTTKNVSVEVKDEFNGQYYYLIEIYAENPLFNKDASQLAKGVAKKGQNLTTSVTLTQEQKGIYVKQTDPKGRVEVYLFDVPEDSDNITCKLFYIELQNRSATSRSASSVATRALAAEYSSIPSDAKEISGTTGALQANESYKITSNYNGVITFNGNGSGTTKLYVAATWNIPQDFTFQNGIEIIVMGNGKIETSHNLSFVNTSTLIILEDGNVSAKDMNFTNRTPAGIKNWGLLTVNNLTMNDGASIDNYCDIEISSSLTIYSNSSFNFDKGYLKASNISLNDAKITLSNGSMIEAGSTLHLSGTYFIGTSGVTSLIKAPTVDGQNFTYDGNLAIESDNHVQKEQYWENFTVKNGAYLTTLGASKVAIVVHSEIKNEGYAGAAPSNPTFPIVTENKNNYSYLFEDQWPLYGDYDMNDLVISITTRKIHTNNNNKVTKFEFAAELLAAGATKSIGAAIMLDAVPASAITQAVVFDNNNPSIASFKLNGKNIENGQDYAVIPLLDDAHKALGWNKYEAINTASGHASNTKQTPKIGFTITFDNPTLSADAFSIDKLNLFIIFGGNSNKRKEIHIAGYQPTKLANTDLFGGNNDDSSISNKKYYISKDNLAWGIMVPTNFKWALEYTNIQTAYPKFNRWVTSGGTEEQNWWSNFDNTKVYNTNKN